MNIDRMRLGVLLAGTALIAGCTTNKLFEQPGDTTYGEANRQTMMAQVIDPDPQYGDLMPAYSGERGATAVEQYRTYGVEDPEGIRTTDVGEGGS